MANAKFTDLNAMTTPAADDVLAIADITADETKKMTAPNLMKIFNLLAALGVAPAAADVFAVYDDDAGSTKKIAFSTLQTALQFPSTTVMLFGQSAPPTGWTKKVDWTDISMIIYTTGAIASGGADDPKSWATALTVDNHAALGIDNHAAIALDNHTALTIDNHTALAIDAHAFSQTK